MLSNKVSRFRIFLPVIALALGILQVGCNTAQPAQIPSSGQRAQNANRTFQVREYALVEASTDNPNHLEFQERALAAVTARRSGWIFSGSNATQAPNQALAPFGYHIAANPTPPFSGFALYRGDQLVQRDIAWFLPVSGKASDNWAELGDFVLSFETLNGEKMIASSAGVRPWPGQEQSIKGLQKPLYPNEVAYANNPGSEIGVVAGSQPLEAGKLAADMFGLQSIAGQPFYFYNSGDLVHLNYAGHDLAYTYDQVVHNNTAGNAIFNPGGTGQVSWFYGLRDGLWYYVEVGMLE